MAMTSQTVLLSVGSPWKLSVEMMKPLPSRKLSHTRPRFPTPLLFDAFGSNWSTMSKHLKIQPLSVLYSDLIFSSLSSDTQSDGVGEEISGDDLSRVFRKIPEPLREFPWKRAMEILVKRLSDIAWSAAKWLLLPVILLSSLSEISYTLVQNKELIIPIGMLAGSLTAAAWSNTVFELSHSLQKGEVPWHLIAIGLIFAFIKFPGPSYPYWGRLFLPHFATGGLLRTYFSALSWQNSLEKTDHHK